AMQERYCGRIVLKETERREIYRRAYTLCLHEALAGLGGETMLKMSLAMAICYLLALLLGLSKPRDAR
nr:hypothetical protein [Klebsiella pneumoniae]